MLNHNAMKRNLLLAMMLTFAMLCGAQAPWNGTIADAYAGGDGTPENPFQIATAEQLAFLAQQTNNGTGGDAYYILTCDIILNDGDSLLWTPIGNIGAFTGVFDGDNHIISGLYENGNKISGLFASTENATIKNTIIENATVLEYEQAYVYSAIGGLLVGVAKNTNILDCTVDGYLEILSTVASGGFAGLYNVDIDEYDTVYLKKCVNNAEVVENLRIGGMIGHTNVSSGNLVLDNCVNNANLTSSGFCGGMIGDGEFIIRNCHNYGEIYAGDCGGGMVGQGGDFGTIINCLNHQTGKIKGEVAGGIIGTAIFTIMSCCGNEALITGYGENEFDDELLVGGISGADGTIYNCYNRGDLTAVFNTGNPLLVQIGGIASTPPSDGQVRNVYNTGTIIKPSNPNIPSALYSHIVPATLSDTLLGNCYWIGNETISPYIYNIETSSWVLIPSSSAFNQGTTATSWILDEAQYGTTDLLEALNAGAMGECVWEEDVDGVNGGLPIPRFVSYDAVQEHQTSDVLVYPNPSHGMINIEVSCAMSLQSSNGYRISNLLGQTVQSGRFNGEYQQVDVSGLSAGMYFITIGDATVKFMKR